MRSITPRSPSWRVRVPETRSALRREAAPHVFGGGTVGATSLFGGARIAIASSGALGLDNDGDTITLRAGTTAIDTVMYGTIAGTSRSSGAPGSAPEPPSCVTPR